MKTYKLLISSIFCLVLAYTSYAQSQQDICRVNGQVLSDSLKFSSSVVKQVYLSTTDEYDRLVKIDSCKLVDGKFYFNIPLQKDAPILMYFINGFDNGMVSFFAEKGEVDIIIQSAAFPNASMARGTLNNELFAEYKAISAKCIEEQKDSSLLWKNKYSEEWLDGPEGQYNRLRIGAKSLINCNAERIAFLLKHNNSPLAPLMFEREISYMLDKRYNDWLLKSLSPSLKNHPYYRSFSNSVKAADLKVGGELPDISLPLINGEVKHLNDYKGKYVLLDFWASWCGPCRKEIPYLQQLSNSTKNNPNFIIISFSLDDKKNNWEKAINNYNMVAPNWLHFSDLLGWGSPSAKMLGVTGIPYMILINPEGRVISFSLRGEELIKRVTSILAGEGLEE